MVKAMDDAEIARLKKEIYRSFGSSPHKKKYWLALLARYVAEERKEQRSQGNRKAPPPSDHL
jgi:hypothetical protein